MQGEALDLGEDIKYARRLASGNQTHAATGTAIADEGSVSREEAKGLLVIIKYLKAKFVRESYARADLSHQKLYLNMLLAQKQRL